MIKPTRFYSDKQEKQIAKQFNGKQVSNSGATKFNKGDVELDNILIECKTVTKKQETFTIRKEWILKNKEEAYSMGKDYGVLAFNFGDDNNYYIIDENMFSYLEDYVNMLEMLEKGKNEN